MKKSKNKLFGGLKKKEKIRDEIWKLTSYHNKIQKEFLNQVGAADLVFVHRTVTRINKDADHTN